MKRDLNDFIVSCSLIAGSTLGHNIFSGSLISFDFERCSGYADSACIWSYKFINRYLCITKKLIIDIASYWLITKKVYCIRYILLTSIYLNWIQLIDAFVCETLHNCAIITWRSLCQERCVTSTGIMLLLFDPTYLPNDHYNI